MADDFSGDISTTGAVAVGGTASGNIETVGDRDWFPVYNAAGAYKSNLGTCEAQVTDNTPDHCVNG